VLSIPKWLYCMHKDCPSVGETHEGLRGEASQGNSAVTVCYGTPSEIGEVDDVFFKQLEEMLLSLALEANKICVVQEIGRKHPTWEIDLKGKGVQESGSAFEDDLFNSQEKFILISQNTLVSKARRGSMVEQETLG